MDNKKARVIRAVRMGLLLRDYLLNLIQQFTRLMLLLIIRTVLREKENPARQYIAMDELADEDIEDITEVLDDY